MTEPVLAQAVGLVSFALGIAVFYQKDDTRLKALMLVFNLNHLLHYVLLGRFHQPWALYCQRLEQEQR